MKKYSRYKNNFGEFIPSFYKWKTIEEQKRIAERLANITNKKREDQIIQSSLFYFLSIFYINIIINMYNNNLNVKNINK